MHWFRAPNVPPFDPARVRISARNFLKLDRLVGEDPSEWNRREYQCACNSMGVDCLAGGYDPETPWDVLYAAHGVFGELDGD